MAELVVSDAKNPINKRVIKIVITFDLMINEVTFNTIFKLYKNEKRFEQMWYKELLIWALSKPLKSHKYIANEILNQLKRSLNCYLIKLVFNAVFKFLRMRKGSDTRWNKKNHLQEPYKSL